MANHSFSDGELIQIMRAEDPTAENRAFIQLSEDPSVKTAIEALLLASGSKSRAVGYLQLRAFQSLTSEVRSKKFEEKPRGDVSLVRMYIPIFGNLLTAEPIRTGESDRVLKDLYKDATVINTIKGVVREYRHLDAQEILNQGFSLFYEAIYEAKYSGQATLRTYLIGICKTLILESGSSGRIKSESGGETLQVKRVILAETFDAFDFKELDDDSRADFRVELEEKSADEQLRERLVKRAIDADKVSEKCKEALNLQYFEDKTLAQIATIMKLEYQSAKNQAKRCREQLGNAIKAINGLETYLKDSLRFNL